MSEDNLNITPFMANDGNSELDYEDDVDNIFVTNDENERNVISILDDNKPINGIEIVGNENISKVEKINKPTIKKNQPKKIQKVFAKQKINNYADDQVNDDSGFDYEDITSFANPAKKKKEPMDQEYFSDASSDYRKYDSDYDSPKPYENKNNRDYGNNRDFGNNNNFGNYNDSNYFSDGATDYRSEIDQNEILKRQEEEKQDLLIKLQQLEAKGMKLSRQFSVRSTYDEVKFEYDKLRSVIEQQESVKFMQNALITFVHGVEIMNKKFDPVGAKLNGWSNSVMEDINSYEGIFERLHEKYRGSVDMAPELELLLTLAQSAFMFHLMESIFKSALPGLGSAIQSDPNLVKGLMGATARAADQSSQQSFQQQQQSTPIGGPSFNIGDMLGPLMGGMMGGAVNKQPQPSPVQPSQPNMFPQHSASFNEALQSGPPKPVDTKGGNKKKVKPRKYKHDKYEDYTIDSDSESGRFSLASSNSDGSEIKTNNYMITSNKKKGSKMISL